MVRYGVSVGPSQAQRDAETKRVEHIKTLERPLIDLRESILKQTDFSSSLSKHVIATTANDTNFVFSPLSMHVVLSMASAGSSGPTQSQLLDFLNSNSVEDLNSLSSQVATLLLADGGPFGGPRLSFPNGVWVDQTLTFNPDFKEIVENDYKAASHQVDFLNKAEEARKGVNAWAEKETNGLIKDLLPPGSVNHLTRLISANALYFKGVWTDKFQKSRTKDADFYLSNGTSSVRVPFMTSKKSQFVRAFDGFKVLSLPYGRGDDYRSFSMVFYLPDEIDGLPALVDRFGSVPGFIQSHLPKKRVPVGDFRVPKFKINFGFEASQVLRGQGLDGPFLPDGLTEVTIGDEGVAISRFFQRACIEVDEEGTEAVAVTWHRSSGGCAPKRVEVETVDFVADHPFLFAVREDVSGGVLFVGQLLNPVARSG